MESLQFLIIFLSAVTSSLACSCLREHPQKEFCKAHFGKCKLYFCRGEVRTQCLKITLDLGEIVLPLQGLKAPDQYKQNNKLNKNDF